MGNYDGSQIIHCSFRSSKLRTSRSIESLTSIFSVVAVVVTLSGRSYKSCRPGGQVHRGAPQEATRHRGSQGVGEAAGGKGSNTPRYLARQCNCGRIICQCLEVLVHDDSRVRITEKRSVV